MYDEHQQLDDELAGLARSLRTGEHMLALLQLAGFALKLDHSIRREERVLALAYPAHTTLLAKLRAEHASLRRLVGLVVAAIDRSDERRALEVIQKLRSVLLLHLVKEERLDQLQA